MNLITAFGLQLNPAAPDVVALVGGGGKSSTLFRLAHEGVARGARIVVTTTTRLGSYQVETAAGLVEMAGDVLPLDAIAHALDGEGQCLLVGAAEQEQRLGVKPEQVDALVNHAPRLGIGALLVEADGSRMLPVKAPAAHEPVLPQRTTVLAPVAGLDGVGRRIEAGHVHRVAQVRALLGLPPAEDQAAEDTAANPARLTPAMVAKLLIDSRGGAKGRPDGARLLPLLNKAERAERLALARIAAQYIVRAGFPALIGAVGVPESAPVLERWAPLAVIVLAAGQSRRMGQAKQLMVVDGEPMVVRALRVALGSGAQQVVVVTGAYGEQVTALLAPWQASEAGRLQLVHNPQWEAGQAGSMQTGLNALGDEMAAALFLPVDQPFVPPALLRRMLGAWRQGARLAAPSVDGMVRGAPGLFDRSLWPELRAIRGDTGARAVLQRYKVEATTFAVSGELLRDVDTPEDLSKKVT